MNMVEVWIVHAEHYSLPIHGSIANLQLFITTWITTKFAQSIACMNFFDNSLGVLQVSSKDGSAQVGRISKQWSGLVKEMFTDADNFGVVFPMDLDVKVKATTLAATFLIVS